MPHIQSPRLIMASLAVLGLSYALPVAALTAVQTVEKEVTIQNADGTETITRTDASTVIPGERVIYTLRYTNDEAEPASNLVMTMPVPKEVVYIDGSAERPGAKIEFSIDGGTNFSSRDALTVQGVNGASRMASAADITHIRWTVAGPVSTQESGELVFKGTLK